ncbi:hypothetical protein CHRY9390_02495 [Chryseobacterium aquaeductus]|uniref:Uncharacterized protein n=1 Tax=Chryseobacterium aquaeductus TaxID=2675056 RepID=A0A9N8MHA5_9FLAO|nr:hypothetical protein CHRY9390_02495 [Chryseobacterium potabilaquae]CAD7812317.1 hypothetical protein CHRY9390_02495 [Chryseobacterium aquaeductus]
MKSPSFENKNTHKEDTKTYEESKTINNYI